MVLIIEMRVYGISASGFILRPFPAAFHRLPIVRARSHEPATVACTDYKRNCAGASTRDQKRKRSKPEGAESGRVKMGDGEDAEKTDADAEMRAPG